VKIDEGEQKRKIVRTNRQSNLRGSCQSNFSLPRHLPNQRVKKAEKTKSDRHLQEMEASSTVNYKNATSVYESVKTYYGCVLRSSKDLKTSACCTAQRPHKVIRDVLTK